MVNISAIVTAQNNVILREFTTNISSNNVSCDINDLANKVFKPYTPFLLGKSQFRQGHFYVNDKLNYFMSHENASEYKNAEITFKANGNYKKVLIFVVFDLTNYAYPKYISANGESYTNKSPIFCFLTETQNNVPITISFDGTYWNKPDIPISIQGVTTAYEIQAKNLFNVGFSGQDRSEYSLPSWGIKSNSGSVEFRDNYGFLDAIKDVATMSGVTIDFYLNSDTKKEQIGSFLISQFSHKPIDKKSTIEFKDELESWNDIEIPFRNLRDEQNLYEFSRFAVTALPKMIQFADNETYQHFINLYVKHPYLKECSAWGAVVKFCEISACRVYCNEKGEPTIKYCGGA